MWRVDMPSIGGCIDLHFMILVFKYFKTIDRRWPPGMMLFSESHLQKLKIYYSQFLFIKR